MSEKTYVFDKVGFKFLKHTADVKFVAIGKTLNKLFSNCAKAFTSVLIDPKLVKSNLEFSYKNKSDKLERLLFDFLEELIFLMDTENFIMNKVSKIEITKDKDIFYINANFSGDKAADYDFSGDIKSMTYHEMYIKQKKDESYEAQVVLDI